MKAFIIKQRKLVSLLLVGLYTFAVLLAGYFHEHSVFKGSFPDLKTSNKSIVSANENSTESCFNLHNSQILIGDIVSIDDYEIHENLVVRESHSFFIFSNTKENTVFFSLRAPPYLG